MAYVPGFNYDLFVSYAREDDREGHVTLLIAALKAFLKDELTGFAKESDIFFDQETLNRRVGIEWERELTDGGFKSALFLPIVSPNYAGSEYCAKEFRWFKDQGELSWKAGSEWVYRISPIRWRTVKEDVEAQLAAEIHSAQNQFQFIGAKGFPYEHPGSQWTDGIKDLGRKIADALQLLRSSREPVFVGEAEPGAASDRKKIIDEFMRMGYRVLPNVPFAYNDEVQLKRLLGEAHMAVHFVGGQRKQLAIDAIRFSIEECKGTTVVYQLPGQDITGPEQIMLKWIKQDQCESASGDGYQLITHKSIGLLLDDLRNQLRGKKEPRGTRVGIACEDLDHATVEDIVEEIKRLGYSVRNHGLKLLDYISSRGVLYYWGEADGDRLRQAAGKLGLTEAWYLAPPPEPVRKEEDLGADLKQAMVLHQQGQRFDINDILPFLDKLR